MNAKFPQAFKIPLPCQFLGNLTDNKHKSIINKLNTNSSCTEKEGQREGSLVGEELIEALGKERSRVSDEDKVGRVENGVLKELMAARREETSSSDGEWEEGEEEEEEASSLGRATARRAASCCCW